MSVWVDRHALMMTGWKGIIMIITTNIEEISRKEREKFLMDVEWGCHTWVFPARDGHWLIYLTANADELKNTKKCGLVLCKAEDRIRKGTEPCLDDVKEAQEMLDLLDSKFPCWKDVRNKQ